MTVNIKMPKWDPKMRNAIITRWLKQEGDSVEKGEDLFEVQTDKNTRIVGSPASGMLSQILIRAGEKVPVKVVVAFLAET